MSLICEISGLLLVTNGGKSPGEDGAVAVVTPSGHVCWKKYLLAKLQENGGVDPFLVPATVVPLREEDLIPLQQTVPSPSSSSMIVPPRTHHHHFHPPSSSSSSSSSSSTTALASSTTKNQTSFTGLLQTLQQEYDAALLELFDTRQTLAQCRQELARSYMQQDAALRVVARLVGSSESSSPTTRQPTVVDPHYEEEDHTTTTTAATTTAAAAAAAATTAHVRLHDPDDDDEEPSLPATKKMRTDETAVETTPAETITTTTTNNNNNNNKVLENDLPPADAEALWQTWQTLQPWRRKQFAKQSPPPVDWTTWRPRPENQSPPAWHPTTCSGLRAMTYASTSAWTLVVPTTAVRSSSDPGDDHHHHNNNNNTWESLLWTAGQDGHVMAYSPSRQQIVGDYSIHTSSTRQNNAAAVPQKKKKKMAVQCLHAQKNTCAVGLTSGVVQVLVVSSPSSVTSSSSSLVVVSSTEVALADSVVVDVRCHPDQVHILAATARPPMLHLLRRETSTTTTTTTTTTPASQAAAAAPVVVPVAVFRRPRGPNDDDDDDDESMEYTCGALHPDGLIYLAGTGTGQILVWDLKNKNCASTLPSPASVTASSDGTRTNLTAVTALAISNNGYHVASALENGAVYIWDLRKQKLVATLNQHLQVEKEGPSDSAPPLASVEGVAFDEHGKHLAYGGRGGLRVIIVKEWTVVASWPAEQQVTHLVWDPQWLAAASPRDRHVTFFGPYDDPNNKLGENEHKMDKE